MENDIDIDFQRARIHGFRLSKYDPKFRDINGVYLKDEWSGYSDIGKKFEDGVLTLEEYELVENKYARAVELFFMLHNCRKIKLTSRRIWSEDALNFINNDLLLEFFHKFKHRKILDITEVANYIKINLRGGLWAKLSSKDNDEISMMVSYDFYMRFFSPIRNEILPILLNETELSNK